MSDATHPSLEQLRAACVASPFSAWAGFTLTSAADGEAVLELVPRPELLQHSGFVHAAITAGMIDTAAGFAAATVAGAVLTASFQTAFYRPATGERLIARARVVRAGKRQSFVNVEVFALEAGSEKLVAGGTAVLMTIG